MNRKIILFNKVVNWVYLVFAIFFLAGTQLYSLGLREFLTYDIGVIALIGTFYMSFFAIFFIILTTAILQITGTAVKNSNVRGYRVALGLMIAAEILTAVMLWTALKIDFSPILFGIMALMLLTAVIQMYITYTPAFVVDIG